MTPQQAALIRSFAESAADNNLTLRQARRLFSLHLILTNLRQQGNIEAAAAVLEIHPETIRRLLKSLGFAKTSEETSLHAMKDEL